MTMQEYPWFKHYPKGIPNEINPDSYNSVIDLLESSFAKFGEKIAYENSTIISDYPFFAGN